MRSREELLSIIAEKFPHLTAPEQQERKLMELNAAVSERLSEPVLLHTIQFFTNDHPENPYTIPKPHGSGVLLRDGDRFFIATASHVVEDREKTHIGVYTPKKDFFEIGTILNTPTGRSETDNFIDIAIWVVEPEYAEDIAPIDRWYDLRDAVTGHKETLEERYLVVGFPATKVEIKTRRQAIIQSPFKFHTRGRSQTPDGRRARKDESKNFLIEFHKDKIANLKDGRREMAPDPHGISGCGLWYFDEYLQRYRLVGIMTEWKQPQERLPLMMGTRIDYVIDTIRQFWELSH